MENLDKGKIRDFVIAVVGIAGIITVAAVAPNALQALAIFGFGKKQPRHRKYYISKVIAHLIKKGLLSKSTQGDIPIIRLTETGKVMLARYRAREKILKPPQNWDGTWHIIIYDVREWRRKDRDRFRIELNYFGFVPIQRSVWVSPHDHEDLITLIKADYKIGKDILYIKANYIENEAKFRHPFGLPSLPK